jgi:hypothetical protein
MVPDPGTECRARVNAARPLEADRVIVAPVQVAQLRPLRVGEILDVAIKIYWANASTLFRLVALVVAPVQALTVLILSSALPSSETFFPQPTFEPPPQQPPLDFDASDLRTAVIGVLLVAILTLVATTLASAACFKAVADAYLGHRPEWRASMRAAIRRLGSVLWIVFLSGVVWVGAPAAIIAGGAVLGAVVVQGDAAPLVVVPAVLGGLVVGVWLYISFAVAVPALLTEDARGTAALRRSFRLIRGRWWPVFGLLVLGAILTAIVSNVIALGLNALTFTDLGEDTLARLIISALSSTVASVIATPFQAAFVAVLYFDLRVRKEGFDLELLADRMGLPPGGAAGSPAPLAPTRPPPEAAGGGSQPPFWPPPPGWRPSSDDPREG